MGVRLVSMQTTTTLPHSPRTFGVKRSIKLSLTEIFLGAAPFAWQSLARSLSPACWSVRLEKPRTNENVSLKFLISYNYLITLRKYKFLHPRLSTEEEASHSTHSLNGCRRRVELQQMKATGRESSRWFLWRERVTLNTPEENHKAYLFRKIIRLSLLFSKV